MTRVLDVVARLFVEPAPAEARESVRWVPPAPGPGDAAGLDRPVVLCAARDCRVAGGAAALALAHVTGAPAVLVLEWTGDERPAGPGRAPSRAARRLCETVGEEEAAASGRLVRVVLPADEEEAATAAKRLLARPVPAVLVVAGARGPAMDALLAEASIALVAARPGADDAVAELALAQACGASGRAMRVTVPASPGAAALARSGTALVAPLRGPFLDVLSQHP